ncbi:MAG: PilZ domain-containing protein [Verrucomicrobiae bacterium]|nr:PilZ domain-containing protein [Verrucomicrobiae bacterium]
MTPYPNERRQFGRRHTCLHGWVLREGLPRLACVVRNVSEGGALLEFEVPPNMPYWFMLRIDCKGFEARCETRRQGLTWMGVQFVKVARIEQPIAEWSALVDDAWRGTGALAAPKRRCYG